MSNNPMKNLFLGSLRSKQTAVRILSLSLVCISNFIRSISRNENSRCRYMQTENNKKY